MNVLTTYQKRKRMSCQGEELVLGEAALATDFDELGPEQGSP